MGHPISKFPGQKFVAIAMRKTDGTLHHEAYISVDAIPKRGALLFDRKVLEVLTEEKLLKVMSERAVNPIEAVAVLSPKREP